MPPKPAKKNIFQGELFRIINNIIVSSDKISFSKIYSPQKNAASKAEYSGGIIYSTIDASKAVYLAIKNKSHDATQEDLVSDAMARAFEAGFPFFVTATPRQLTIYKTLHPNTLINNRKLKIYHLSNIKKADEILSPYYEKQITPVLKELLSDLSDLVHNLKDIHWDSIDAFFTNKLSSYILEASAEMVENMYNKIKHNNHFKKQLEKYFKEQNIFNVTLSFDYQDVYNICQVANYLLFLKIMFYSYLYQEVEYLNLKPLNLPKDKNSLRKTLRSRFDDVLKHDFEMIFSESILDKFEFPDTYIPVFRKNVEELQCLNYKELNADIIGSIYNTLIKNQEQHKRGQHFTNTHEVDIINAFTFNQNSKLIFDSACGAGTFLVRAYFFLKHFHPDLTHEQLLENLWGVEVAPFPAFLATMNLTLLNIKSPENYPVIINEDFSEVRNKQYYQLHFSNTSKTFRVKNLSQNETAVQIPEFDACVGNPPYIRQELVDDKEKWTDIINKEWDLKKINKQSDLYVYYLMHTAAFLKEDGRLGYVIAGSWLDVSYGTGLQQFILDNFKIIAIIDNQKLRSFSTASVNTVILIIEKCNDQKERENNNIRFVRIYSNYETLIGTSSDPDRVEKALDFAKKIENIQETTHNKDYQVTVINQGKLGNDSTINGKYQNGHWGAKYLRSPLVISELFEKPNDKLIPLSQIAEVKYGIKTGANDFFYLTDETEKAQRMSAKDYEITFGRKKNSQREKSFWKTYGWYYSKLTKQHYLLEREYFIPVLKSQQEASGLDVRRENLKYHVLICHEEKHILRKNEKRILKYIEEGEKRNIHKRPSINGRPKWYDISGIASVGDFIFPSKIGERYRLINNRESKVVCDKVNYVINIKKEYQEYLDLIFLMLNSIFFRHLIDLFSRQLTGSQTLSDVDVNVVEQSLILNPLLLKDPKYNFNSAKESLKKREQGTIFDEINMEDKKIIDKAIFTKLGYNAETLKDFYEAAAKYVADRATKSASVKGTKSK